MIMEDSHIEAVRPGQQDTGLPQAPGLPKGPRCAVIIAADPALRVSGFQAVATLLAEAGAASVRVGNPLSSPLTLRRILFQIDLDGGGDDADVDDEAHLVRLLEERRGTQDHIVLVVERAETLDTAALLSLQRLASAPGAVQVVFVGTSAFWALLDDAGLTPLRRALIRQGTEPAAAAPPVPVVPPPAAPIRPAPGVIPDRSAGLISGPRPAASARPGRRWWVAGTIGLAAFFALGAAAVLAPGGLFYYAVPQREMPPHPDVAAGPEQPPAASQPRSPMSPVVSAPAAPPPPQVAPPTRPPTVQAGSPAPLAPTVPSPAARAETQQTRPQPEPAQLPNAPRRGADHLADAQWDTQAGQSEQSLSWRLRDLMPPTASSSSEGRVVIHYRGGSVTGQAEAERLAVVAAPLAAKVQTRIVAETPSAPVIRFFHPEDEARARQLAGTLSGPGRGWDVRDFGSFRPRSSPGTIEVWTPTR